MKQEPEKSDNIHDVYHLQKRIGSGNFSTVRQAVHKVTGEKVAVKVAVKSSLTEEDIAAVYVEVDCLKKVRKRTTAFMLMLTWYFFFYFIMLLQHNAVSPTGCERVTLTVCYSGTILTI